MKKGFTLIELLAVIVILAIIALIATPIVLNIINDSKKSSILRSADFYIDARENEIALENMKVGGRFNPNICNIDNDGNALCDDYDTIEIKVDGEKPNGGSITFENGKVTDVNLTYPNGNITLNNKGELVLGESTNKSICKLVSGEPNEIGSKYQCKVKDNMEEGFEDGYYFNVLSHNDEGTTNLIMERNIYYDESNVIGAVSTEEKTGLVEWYSYANDHSYGPVTAMTYLHNATKDWNNIPNIIVNYEDENIHPDTEQKGSDGYGNIITTGNTTIITSKSEEETLKIENLKARLPKHEELYGEKKCSTEDPITAGKCPLWLVNYLSNYYEYTAEEGKVDINGIKGYWTLSTCPGLRVRAWLVFYVGSRLQDSVRSKGYAGVRPVITIEL